jgi:hypothetical protein
MNPLAPPAGGVFFMRAVCKVLRPPRWWFAVQRQEPVLSSGGQRVYRSPNLLWMIQRRKDGDCPRSSGKVGQIKRPWGDRQAALPQNLFVALGKAGGDLARDDGSRLNSSVSPSLRPLARSGR